MRSDLIATVGTYTTPCSVRARISLSDTLKLLLNSRSNRNALAYSPVSVLASRTYPSIVSKERSGWPAQFRLMQLNTRHPRGFHLEAPVG